MQIHADRLEHPQVHALLREHLAHMREITPAQHVFALDLAGLKGPGITFYTVWDGETLLGCGALKELSRAEGEVKSMRTPKNQRRRGAGRAVLLHIVEEARRRGYHRLYLETGTHPDFGASHALYRSAGFVGSGPFGEYRASADNQFMVLDLRAGE